MKAPTVPYVYPIMIPQPTVVNVLLIETYQRTVPRVYLAMIPRPTAQNAFQMFNAKQLQLYQLLLVSLNSWLLSKLVINTMQ